ncbi:MAG: LacI family DNA-binding transcriptional regulator [Capsulimonadaceae bacterium]|nr:LacI family DNA-binding transcriptional regulator [Capsulimonadaceae bacterium]
MPVTLKDIADQTGVSPSVVSTVLSGRDNGTFVSKDTRERVLRVAEQLNYTPVRSGRPRGSRRLRRQRVEQFIGIWSPDMDATGAIALNALQKALTRHAAQQTPAAGDDYDYGFRMLTEADLPKLDMLALMGLIVLGDTLLPRSAAAATIPTVMLGEADESPREMVTVHLDNFAAGRSLGDHLWSLGHRHVAFVGPSAKPRARVTRQRWQGLQSSWVDHGTPADFCVPAPYDTFRNLSFREQVHKMADALIDAGKVTAFVCFNESVATFLLQAVLARGLSVPRQVSVVTFGDSPGGAEALAPPLTTIRPPMLQIATSAIAQLYSMHDQASTDGSFAAGIHRRDIAYVGELMVRSSTAAIEPANG